MPAKDKIVTKNSTYLQRLPADLLAVINAAAAQAGISRTQLVIDVLTERFGDVEHQPPILLGWIAIDRPGELDDYDCPECGQNMHDPHIGIMSSGILTDVVCGGCAGSGE